MQTHPLQGPRFLQPQWFNRVRHGQHAAMVGDDGSVILDGESLRFASAPLASGTAVKVWLNAGGFFVCATDDDLSQWEKEQEMAAQAEREACNQARDALRVEAQAFNARLKLPVRWDAGMLGSRTCSRAFQSRQWDTDATRRPWNIFICWSR